LIIKVKCNSKNLNDISLENQNANKLHLENHLIEVEFIVSNIPINNTDKYFKEINKVEKEENLVNLFLKNDLEENILIENTLTFFIIC